MVVQPSRERQEGWIESQHLVPTLFHKTTHSQCKTNVLKKKRGLDLLIYSILVIHCVESSIDSHIFLCYFRKTFSSIFSSLSYCCSSSTYFSRHPKKHFMRCSDISIIKTTLISFIVLPSQALPEKQGHLSHKKCQKRCFLGKAL